MVSVSILTNFREGFTARKFAQFLTNNAGTCLWTKITSFYLVAFTIEFHITKTSNKTGHTSLFESETSKNWTVSPGMQSTKTGIFKHLPVIFHRLWGC